MNIRITIETKEEGQEFFELTTRSAEFFGLALALAMEAHQGAMPSCKTPIGHLADAICEYEGRETENVSEEEKAFLDAAARFVQAID